jgi:hypothetical protein
MTNVSVRRITLPQAEEELAERIALGEELLNEIRHGLVRTGAKQTAAWAEAPPRTLKRSWSFTVTTTRPTPPPCSAGSAAPASSPYVGDVLDQAFRDAQAVVAFFKLPSDLAGRHYMRLGHTAPEPLRALASRLSDAGCDVDLGGTGWLDPGRFPDRGPYDS